MTKELLIDKLTSLKEEIIEIGMDVEEMKNPAVDSYISEIAEEVNRLVHQLMTVLIKLKKIEQGSQK